MQIFATGMPGKTAAMETADAVPALVKLDGLSASTVLIQSMGVSQSANVQFMQSLKDKIYIYVFGEAPGTLTVSGIILYHSCNVGSSSGLKEILNYYRKNSVTKRSSPVHIVIGTSSIDGYLRQVDGSIDNPELGMGRFTFTMTSIPK